MIARVFDGPSAFDGRERALIDTVDSLMRSKDVDDSTWARFRQHFNERQAIELCMLVGHYEMLATTITALRIERDF